MVRRISGNQLVISPDDHRVVWFRITAKTVADKNGTQVDVATFQPGDRITVEATEDDSGFLTAVNVEWNRAGSPAERAAALETWDLPGAESAVGGGGATRRDSSSNVDDDDRPILRRHDSGADAQTPPQPQAAPPQPTAQPSQPAAQAPQQAAQAEDTPPPPPATQMAPANAPADPEDPGRPVLRRGGAAVARAPENRSNPVQQAGLSAPPQTANRAPSGPQAGPAVASVPRPPATPQVQEDPLIVKVRDAAYNFSASLPNFFCQQMTTRYRTENIKQGWETIDLVSADVAYEDGHEAYKNIRVGNGRAVQSMDQIGGTRSTGEFSSQLQDLMSDSTGAVFRRAGTDTIQGRSAIVFNYDVPRERSHWRVEAPSQLYYPAFRGTIYVDKATSRVLRLEQQARNLPKAFPFDTVESATDYAFIRLAAGEQEYLLPGNAEVLSCERGTSFCSRNRIEFRNYKKFDAASSISFK